MNEGYATYVDPENSQETQAKERRVDDGGAGAEVVFHHLVGAPGDGVDVDVGYGFPESGSDVRGRA